jgi:hypothetical protein
MSANRRFAGVLSETFWALLTVAGLAVAAMPAFAQTFTDLHDFNSVLRIVGAEPAGVS